MIVHLPVMVREVVEMLNIRSGGTYVDATVGLGGHAEEILNCMGPDGRLVGMDRDDDALNLSGERLKDRRVTLKKGKFSDLKNILSEEGIHEIDGILFDFGVSMMQFADPSRGFSFHSEEPLDMRMDRGQKKTASDIVNTLSEHELERILWEYGEERFAKRIARAIVAERIKQKIVTCAELAEIVSRVYRVRGRRHPATKTFQALRIAVNDEITEIRNGLEASLALLCREGRLCAISYHSLEDRTVKYFLRDAQKNGMARIITKKPMTPLDDEIRKNPSARSAKLRGMERL
jgi:16S rRNA (cytosine1402-N4)-methyltransferase